MRCEEVRQLLYLGRPGEMPEKKREELARHLEACEACAAEQRSTEGLYRQLDMLRAVEPILHEPASLTATIMRGIDRTTDAEPALLPTWIFHPSRVRFSLRLVLAILVGVLLVEAATDTRRMVSLEQRLHKQNPATAFQPLQSGVSTSSEALEALLRFAGQRPGEARTLFDDMRARYPELASITLEDGLSEVERKVLDTEGRKFLRDFEQLIQTGGNHD